MLVETQLCGIENESGISKKGRNDKIPTSSMMFKLHVIWLHCLL